MQYKICKISGTVSKIYATLTDPTIKDMLKDEL